MSGQDPSGFMFGRKNIICPRVPEIPFKGELVHDRNNLTMYLFTNAENNGGCLALILADNNIMCCLL